MASTTKIGTAKAVTNIKLGIQTGTTYTIYATWDWSGNHLDHYEVTWAYYVNGIWFWQSSSSANTKTSTYSPPDNAVAVKVKIQPIAKSHSVKESYKDDKGKTKTKSVTKVYWKASAKKSSQLNIPKGKTIDAPGAPDIAIDKGTITVSIQLDPVPATDKATKETPTHVEFQIVKNDDTVLETKLIPLNALLFASYKRSINPGEYYKARCRSLKCGNVTRKVPTGQSEGYWATVNEIMSSNLSGAILIDGEGNKSSEKGNVNHLAGAILTSKVWKTRPVTKTVTEFKRLMQSEWSSFSSTEQGTPGTVSTIYPPQAITTTSVRVSWAPAVGAKGYEVAYVKNNPDYFDIAPSEVQTSSADDDNPSCVREILNLENTGGVTYYFRVRAHNDKGFGGWSDIVSAVLATIPDAPTTWSYITTAVIGETVDLNWSHNNEDNSAQTAAQIQITTTLQYEEGVTPDPTPQTIQITGDAATYQLDTSGYSDGTVITWKVRTKGIPNSPDGGYGPWSTTRQVAVYAPAGLELELLGGLHWLWNPFNFQTDTIYSAQADGDTPIDTVDKFPFVIKGTGTPSTQQVVSMVFSIIANEGYSTLEENGKAYIVHAGETVYQEYFSPEDGNTVRKTMTPGDVDLEDGISYTLFATVSMNTGLSATASLDFDVSWEESHITPNAELTISGSDLTCYIRPYCVDDSDNEVLDATLAVYRREYDGKFTLIAGNIEASARTTVSDPHPSLDYARYRIVAQSHDTGAISFFDMPGEEIGYSAIVITWDEEWTDFNSLEGEIIEVEDGGISGSKLTLPYNIDVSADYAPSVELVEYIGREHPVSYYGTQTGETANWSTEIPKTDTETLYQIRRLAVYPGDVYVREPSGIGYWAQVKVSYKITHCQPTIPVTLNVTRVEGGV